MPGLGYIKGISDEAATLLEAAGVSRPADLATQNVDALYAALQVANRYEKAFPMMPAKGEVHGWIVAARELVETIAPGSTNVPGSPKTGRPKISSRKPEPAAPAARLKTAPAAARVVPEVSVGEPVPSGELDDEDVMIAEIVEDDDLEAVAGGSPARPAPPKGQYAHSILPEHRATDFTEDTLAHLEKIRARREVDMGYGSPKVEVEDDIWKDVDKNAFATFDQYEGGRMRVQPLQRYNGNVVVKVEDGEDGGSMPRVERIETSDPDENVSRFVRRGVNYPYPVTAFLSAVFVLLFRLYMVAIVIALPISLIQLGDKFGEYWVPTVIIIAVFLLLGIAHMIINTKVRCRVCSCPLFYSQRCYKNKKAHLVKGLGYVASLALHLVFFQWYRCMYCGTAIRIRGAAKTKRMEVLDARALDIDDDDDDPIKSF